MACICSWQSK